MSTLFAEEPVDSDMKKVLSESACQCANRVEIMEEVDTCG
jgi:hypothetical protein